MPARTAGEIAVIVGEACEPAWRWWRWVAHLPGERIAFVAEDDAAWERLARERAVLAALEQGVAVAVPRVVVHDGTRRVQVRVKVPGISGLAVEALVFGRADRLAAEDRYAEDCPRTAAGRRLAGDLGRTIAEMQAAVGVDEARRLKVPERTYAALIDRIDEVLAGDAALADLRESLPALRAWADGLTVGGAFGLADLQMHNVAVDAATGALAGVFDLDDMCVGPAVEDFKYLPSLGVAFAEEALAAYRKFSPRPVTLADVGMAHVLSALEHFNFVDPAGARWPQIIGWSRAAVARFVR